MTQLSLPIPDLKGKLKSPVILIVIGVLCVAALIITMIISGLSNQNAVLNEEIEQLKLELIEANKIDVLYVGNKLETISELATAEMTYNGMIHFTEGDIPFINKKEFYMFYRVSIKAGFDLSQAQINVTEHTVTINLPAVEIYEPVVDEQSFQFFDQTTSLFNHEDKNDLIEAITEAKEDALAQPETENMKETAKTQVIALITALFDGQIGDRELIINIG